METSKISSFFYEKLNQLAIRKSDGKNVPEISQVTTNSRIGDEQYLFISLTGEKYRGVEFTVQAIERGIRVFCINNQDLDFFLTQIPKSLKGQVVYFTVDDTTATYGQLAHHYLKFFNGVKIAITGSAGKTSLKENLSHFLSSLEYKIFKSEKNENNLVGIPQNIFRITQNYDYYIFELGTSHPGEITRLSQIIAPNHTVIYNILPAHIGNFKNFSSLAREKISITEHQVASSSSFVFFPNDLNLDNFNGLNPLFKLVKYSPKYITEKVIVNKDRSFMMNWEINSSHHVAGLSGLKVSYKGINFFGKELVACLLKILYHVIPEKKLKDLQKNFTFNLIGVGRRMEIIKPTVKQQRPTLIDDAYNANPITMKLATLKLIEVFEATSLFNHLWLVLGDMLELGEDSLIYHREVIEILLSRISLHTLKTQADDKINLCLVGPLMTEALASTLNKMQLSKSSVNISRVHTFNSSINLWSFLRNMEIIHTSETLFYFKASNGMNFDKIIANF